MKNRQLLASWAQHDVYEGNNPQYVIKLPKKNSSLLIVDISEIQNYCSFLQKHFWKFMPKTKIIPCEWWYWVVQEKINGKILREVDPKTLSYDTLVQLEELITTWHQLAVEELLDIDIFWKRIDKIANIEKKFEKFAKYVEQVLINPQVQKIFPEILLKTIYFAQYINYHYIWHFYVYNDFFSSSNIMIDETWWVFFVDNAGLLGQFWIQKERLQNLEISYRKLMLNRYRNQVHSIMESKT